MADSQEHVEAASQAETVFFHDAILRAQVVAAECELKRFTEAYDSSTAHSLVLELRLNEAQAKIIDNADASEILVENLQKQLSEAEAAIDRAEVIISANLKESEIQVESLQKQLSESEVMAGATEEITSLESYGAKLHAECRQYSNMQNEMQVDLADAAEEAMVCCCILEEYDALKVECVILPVVFGLLTCGFLLVDSQLLTHLLLACLPAFWFRVLQMLLLPLLTLLLAIGLLLLCCLLLSGLPVKYALIEAEHALLQEASTGGAGIVEAQASNSHNDGTEEFESLRAALQESESRIHSLTDELADAVPLQQADRAECLAWDLGTEEFESLRAALKASDKRLGIVTDELVDYMSKHDQKAWNMYHTEQMVRTGEMTVEEQTLYLAEVDARIQCESEAASNEDLVSASRAPYMRFAVSNHVLGYFGWEPWKVFPDILF